MRKILSVGALLAALAFAGAVVTAQETPTKPTRRQMGPMMGMMGQGGQMDHMGNMGAMMKMMQGMTPMMEQCRQMMGGAAPSGETDQR